MPVDIHAWTDELLVAAKKATIDNKARMGMQW
jgi:hypothetical protein